MSNISVPATTKAPRDLSTDERAVIARVADTLIPATEDSAAASAEPGFWEGLPVALDARADAFGVIVGALETLAGAGDLWSRLQSLDDDQPSVFQALSTIVAGAWLLAPGTQDRIGYYGLQSDRAGLEEAADEISSGVLDAVVERGNSRWIR